MSKEIVDRVGRVENVGVNFIPDEQRKSRPLNIW
jgi:hypothetical protein